MPFDQNLQINELQSLGYTLVDNSEEEISACFDGDFYNKNFAKKSIEKLILKKYMNKNNYSYNALGELSPKYMNEFYNINV